MTDKEFSLEVRLSSIKDHDYKKLKAFEKDLEKSKLSLTSFGYANLRRKLDMKMHNHWGRDSLLK